MKTPLIYIDGEAGTTGLQIRARLQGRKDIDLLLLNDKRKDLNARRSALNEADIVVLCLPDDAAREAVSLIETKQTRVLDASTAHRVNKQWVYGFVEYDLGQDEIIKNAHFVSNPGCYALSSISLIYPLIKAGVIGKDEALSINAISGYSGGGKDLIRRFEDGNQDDSLQHGFHLYGLSLNHKHLPEITHYSGLERQPIFIPSVGRFRQGMLVSLPLHLDGLKGHVNIDDLYHIYNSHYPKTGQIKVKKPDYNPPPAMLIAEDYANQDDLTIHLFASKDQKRALLVASLDNLGKGASGQAMQTIDLWLKQ